MNPQSKSQKTTVFDPFKCRICRHIRNVLAHSLMEAIQRDTLKPARKASDKLRQESSGTIAEHYINDRLSRYQTVITQLRSVKITHGRLHAIALLLWDQELFFEVHEWLEKSWLRSKGPEKVLLQALIRAAGTYAHLEKGRNEGARKMSSKAIPALIEHKTLLPVFFDIAQLIESLKTLDPVPPKLMLPTHVIIKDRFSYTP